MNKSEPGGLAIENRAVPKGSTLPTMEPHSFYVLIPLTMQSIWEI